MGEVRAFQGKYADAADAYKRSIKESGGRADLEQLQGLAGALAGAGREAEAVAAVRSALEEASRGSASAEGAEGAANGVGEVEARLLLGKVYAQWKGHVGDATAVYDELIQKYPEDFRGYLAKGVLLRDNGSKVREVGVQGQDGEQRTNLEWDRGRGDVAVGG